MSSLCPRYYGHGKKTLDVHHDNKNYDPCQDNFKDFNAFSWGKCSTVILTADRMSALLRKYKDLNEKIFHSVLLHVRFSQHFEVKIFNRRKVE